MGCVKFFALWLFLQVATSYTLLPENSEHRLYLAHRCVSTSLVSKNTFPVIMLHGGTESKETWDGIYQSIAFLTRRRVCVYDARNHGDSGWNDTTTIDVLAEDLNDFMTFMGIKKAALVGHSMGGLTVMRFALKQPSKAERIVVEDISPNIAEGISEGIRARLTLFVKSLSVIPDDADEETAKKAVADFISSVTKEIVPYKRLPLHCKDGVWQWKTNIEAVMKAFNDTVSLYGKMEGRYNGRSLFIYGKASPVRVLEDKAAVLKNFPNTEFFGVEGAGHTVHAHGRIFLRRVVKFLNQK